LFPADFLDSISIIKTYTPDLPGDFSAGLADIELLDFPDALTYGFGLSSSGNSNTTFQDFTTYDGDSHDYFGFGGNERALPDIIPDRIGSQPAAQRQSFGRSFKDNWETHETTAPNDFGVNGQIGNRFGPLGVRLAFTYNTKYRRRNEHQRQFLQQGSIDDPGDVTNNSGDNFEFDRDQFKVRLGAVLAASYAISPNHRITLRSLLDRNSTDEVLTGRGLVEQTKRTALPTQLQYKQDELAFGQVGGQHHFDVVDIDWRTALSRTTQNIPDWRITNRVVQDDGSAVVSGDSGGGTRVFADLTEYLTDSKLDVTVPFKTGLPGEMLSFWEGLPAKLKFGPAYAFRERESTLRTFNFRAENSLPDPTAPFDDIYAPGNIGVGDPFPINFSENTQPQNAFQAHEDLFGGYGMLELPILRDRLRVIGGSRVEYSYTQLDVTVPTIETSKVIKNHTDPMPSVGIIYSPRSDMNVRGAWSQTVSRPEFRELSPAIYPAPRGLRGFLGNPTLDQTDVMNVDVRWEWFFSPTELISVSGFYKEIDAPIEQSVSISGSAAFDTFQQNKDAKLYGFEFEGRKDLDFISPWLTGLSFATNVSYVQSEVTAQVRAANPNTGEPAVIRKRDLQGQAPFVVNATLEYTHPDYGTARVLYNTIGDTIERVQDVNSLPDFVKKRRDSLDFVYLKKAEIAGVPLTFKLAVENLINDKYLTTVGGVLQEDYRTGVTASFGVSYAY
ncbi:MAG: TonB-dependent receptor, partial [Candidatus Binatia bacterium]